MIPGLSIPITIDLQRLYGQKINLVQGENAGRRLAFTIVSGGAAVNLTGKILLLTGTKTDGSPVCLPITISSATTGKAYCDIVSGLVSVVGDATLQIRILTPAITGTATSGTTTSMYDTSKTWAVNGYVGAWLYINSGTGVGQARRIISNTATQLVVSDAWGANPAAGSGYSIVTETGFSFPFTANVAASPNADAGIVQTGDFSALTAAIATAAGLDAAAVHKDGGLANAFAAMPYVGTAPIVESGSNANGEYAKFANGTMICSRKKLTIYAANAAIIPEEWAFPVAFYSEPKCSGQVIVCYEDGVGEGYAIITGDSSCYVHAASYRFVFYRLSGAMRTLEYDLTAIGRWKA